MGKNRKYITSTFGGRSHVHNHYSGQLYAEKVSQNNKLKKQLIEKYNVSSYEEAYWIENYQFMNLEKFDNYCNILDKKNDRNEKAWFHKVLSVKYNLPSLNLSSSNLSELINIHRMILKYNASSYEEAYWIENYQFMNLEIFDDYCKDIFDKKNDRNEKAWFHKVLSVKYNLPSLNLSELIKIHQMTLLTRILDSKFSEMPIEEIRSALNRYCDFENAHKRDDTGYVYRVLNTKMYMDVHISESVLNRYLNMTIEQISINLESDFENWHANSSELSFIRNIMINQLILYYKKMTIDQISAAWNDRHSDRLSQYEFIILRIIHLDNGGKL